MEISLQEVKTSQHYRDFIYLPAKIHKHHTQWVPPLWMDEKVFFNPKKNKSFDFCDTILLLAYHGNEPVGRIMGIIHRSYNELRKEKNGRFGFMETFDDLVVAHELLHAVELWAKQKGMERIIGPYGFSDKDPQGFLIEGFESLPLIAASCNFPYQVDLVEQQGYTKEIDCIVYRLPVNREIPELHQRIYDRVIMNNHLELIEFSHRSQLKPWIVPILELMNECFIDIYGFIPLTYKEMQEFADRYMPVIDPRFVKVMVKDKVPISFAIGLPNFSPGLQKAKGYLFPFGIFHIMRSLKRATQVDVMLGGVKSRHQGKGLDVLMSLKLINSAKAAGIEYIGSHLILETNHKMLAELLRFDATLYKRFRVFQKSLL